MDKLKKFFLRKDVVFTMQRYGIDALGAMAQGLFCTLLVGTILNTIGQQFGIAFLNQVIVTIGSGEGAASYTIGGLASAMVGPGIAIAIGFEDQSYFTKIFKSYVGMTPKKYRESRKR